MGENEVNWFGGGKIRPNSEIPTASLITPESSQTTETKANDNQFEGLEFVREHPGFDILFNQYEDLPNRELIFATWKGDMSLPNENGEKDRVYMIWARDKDEDKNGNKKQIYTPVAITTLPSRYTDEIRNIN